MDMYRFALANAAPMQSSAFAWDGGLSATYVFFTCVLATQDTAILSCTGPPPRSWNELPSHGIRPSRRNQGTMPAQDKQPLSSSRMMHGSILAHHPKHNHDLRYSTTSVGLVCCGRGLLTPFTFASAFSGWLGIVKRHKDNFSAVTCVGSTAVSGCVKSSHAGI